MDYFSNSLGFGNEDYYEDIIGYSWDPPKRDYIPLDIIRALVDKEVVGINGI